MQEFVPSPWLSTATGPWPNGRQNEFFFAVVELTRAFVPLILKAGLGSKIVFSNSVAAVAPMPTQVLYDASKAAFKMYADVLRLELEPLGIYIVNVMTGEVGTTMAEQCLEKLPQGSPYESIRDIINKSWSGRKTVMPVREHTTTVVEKVSQQHPPKQIWLGGNALLVWVIELLGLHWLYGFMFRKEYGLDKPLLCNVGQS
ncbi:NADPH-dependent 1-acyl dihydroxyacetone phosphate reductase [Cadophora gregata]|uniref:NADPH-dependent 1-acyl dihydroxyacetone phosphate reductase n=1 Tax=Cadophora gregata TaxID=51156 RepID=UPI0026DAB02E|nr:NADPH-dependent 1-acyl dihydroxyacetone phosphate reductase [Cadophora gregata]KAK0115719.1 NADPH-dependent 1-acyl dihydroxyacetone phosphate reductase [Cadophora gregata f. sp. sojae]KAK0128035.1 NADPH-dependent 1-acyl dihydroxyacetone phosphate reductase [Cadophora gregata]